MQLNPRNMLQLVDNLSDKRIEMVEQTDLIAIANGILAYVEGDSSIE